MLLSKNSFSIKILLKWAVASFSAVVLSACQSPAEQHNSVNKVVPVSKQPNIVIIVADDMGFSDLGAFGSEVPTPNLDKIAQEGTKFSRFYASSSCSPSRAMLLTGADNHLVGIGNMAETIMDNQVGKPGYETYLNTRVTTFAEDLQSQGYHTYMAGKWHLGLEKKQGPTGRGFERGFSALFGAGSHYGNGFGPDNHRRVSLYREDGKLVKALPKDFYSSDYFTDRIIGNIQEQQSSGKPFLAYLAFTAPHWPLQFPPDYKGEFADTYKVGWEKVRQARLAKLRRSGLFKGDLKGSEPENLADWESLSAEDKALAAKDMEIYAAMVANLDANVGRLVQYLKQQNMYDDTFILFLSDNGASHWSSESAPPIIANFAEEFNNSLENRGQPDSFVFYGEQWAQVSNTPFKQFKGTTYEGGIHVPAFMKLPGSQKQVEINDKVIGIEMVKSALLDIANNRSDTSLNPMFTDTDKPENKVYLGREMWGKQGVISDEWSLVKAPKPIGTGQWQLFNVVDDPAETVDLIEKRPALASHLQQYWQRYVKENGVIMPEGKFIIRAPGLLPVE